MISISQSPASTHKLIDLPTEVISTIYSFLTPREVYTTSKQSAILMNAVQHTDTREKVQSISKLLKEQSVQQEPDKGLTEIKTFSLSSFSHPLFFDFERAEDVMEMLIRSVRHGLNTEEVIKIPISEKGEITTQEKARYYAQVVVSSTATTHSLLYKTTVIIMGVAKRIINLIEKGVTVLIKKGVTIIRYIPLINPTTVIPLETGLFLTFAAIWLYHTIRSIRKYPQNILLSVASLGIRLAYSMAKTDAMWKRSFNENITRSTLVPAESQDENITRSTLVLAESRDQCVQIPYGELLCDLFNFPLKNDTPGIEGPAIIEETSDHITVEAEGEKIKFKKEQFCEARKIAEKVKNEVKELMEIALMEHNTR